MIIKLKSFVKKEIVFVISLIAAIISSFFIPPDIKWLNYFDLKTLSLLYTLMIIVVGFRNSGVFIRLSHILCIKASTVRNLSTILIVITFFSSMLITNDVALLTFVPFSIAVLKISDKEDIIPYTIVVQTIAANLGSTLLPVGNPQNIYIQSHYDITFFEFIHITLPIWLVSLFLILVLCLFINNSSININFGDIPIFRKEQFIFYCIMFIITLLVVFRIINWPIMLIIVVISILLFDKETLFKADFILLLTFICFFIFSGNISRLDKIKLILENFLNDHEYLTLILSSQIISNVPSTLLFTNYTEAYKQVLLGANIGGLGTPIASLASLISLRLYMQSNNANKSRFIKLFTILNFLILIILALIFKC